MNKIAFIVLLALFLAPAALACAGGNSQLIMRISSPSNAHAELWNGAGNYPTEICYDAIFEAAYPASGTEHNCTGANGVLRLSSPTNAHIRDFDWPSPFYLEEVCFGDLVCDIVGGGNLCTVFDPDAECIATISNTTNAHIATCLGSPYPLKVCCSSNAAAVPYQSD